MDADYYYVALNYNHTKKLQAITYARREPVTKPTYVENNIEKKFKDFINRKYIYNCWNKFYKHQFLIDNNLYQIEVPNIEDLLYTIQCLCCVTKYVRIPNVFYIYHIRNNSLSHAKSKSVEELFKRYLFIISKSVKDITNFFSHIPYFANSLPNRLELINFCIHDQMNSILPYYKDMKKIDKIDKYVSKYL